MELGDPAGPTARFTAALSRRDVPLDEAALCIAAHARPIDVDAWVTRLDELAGEAPARFEDLAAWLFGPGGYAGNTADYGDPANSFLPEVIERRLGIPISLSVLMMEIGRRAGVAVLGVGMPGHFLVRSGADPELFCDPFDGGSLLDRRGCAHRLHAVYGDAVPFSDAFLVPTPPERIVDRMLVNLQQIYAARDPAELRWVVALRLRIPGRSAAERRALAAAVGSTARLN